MVINKAHISSPNPLVSNLNNTRSRMMLPQRRRLSEATADQPGDTGRMTPGSVTPTTDIASVMENFKNKNSMVAGRQNKLNSLNALNQRNQQLSSSSSQVLSNSSTSTTSSSSTLLAQSSSSRVHHMKAKAVKSGLNEMQNSMSEMRNLTDMRNITEKFRSSMENLVDGNDGDGSIDLHLDDIQQPLVTFPDPESPPPGELQLENLQAKAGSLDTVQFEAKSSTSASTRKVVTDGFSSEKNVQNSAQSQSLRAGDVSYRESSNANASRARLELDGVRAEKSVASLQENRSLKTGDMEQQESNKAAATTMKVRSSAFSAEQSASAQALQRQTMAGGVFNQEKHSSSSSHSNITMSSKTASILTATQLSELMNGGMKGDEDTLALGFEDLEKLSTDCNPQDVKDAIQKYSHCLDTFVKGLRKGQQAKAPGVLDKIHEILRRAWAVPTHGHELGYSLCNALRNSGGLELLMTNCITDDAAVKFSSAQLLEQCLTTENRAYVVENGLEKVVNVACLCTKTSNSAVHSRVGTGILEHLFKHSEVTCGDVIRLGGLDAVLFECRKNDIDTLRHCAGALANLSLYGGAENQEAMIKRKVPMWLFPLAFHNDDHIKYYACLAIAVLVANKEIEAAVLKSGTLDLVEPFVTSHNPSEFAKSNLAHAHGQSKFWLQRLVPVLSSKREEARNLAAFHFCMEAGIKQQQGNTEIFREIGAVEPLKKVASCPNAVASKYAAQALRLIGEEVPHKLSQQVPLWSIEDVREWVKQIGFAEYADYFVDSRVDGDLLLQLTEDNLQEDIGLTNGIRRKRFTRELQNLKKMADYSSRDQSNLNSFLQNIAPEFSIYTYSMLNAGVDRESLRNLGDDHLIAECGIHNSIHRLRILEQLKKKYDEDCAPGLAEENVDKNLDVFVSYRRSNGSQLASLLKVHLQLRGFSVFIDVERLEAGKFDNNLLQSIRHAKHFLLVLTPKALERCKADVECKDWVHREIVAALQSQCNIIPIIDNFTWPEAEELPDDMRAVCHFNGVRWIHDYQDACVDKLERFMRGEMNFRDGPNRYNMGSMMGKGDATPGTPASSVNMRHPPTYQRMHSSDSSKSGDKDMNGNGSAKD